MEVTKSYALFAEDLLVVISLIALFSDAFNLSITQPPAALMVTSLVVLITYVEPIERLLAWYIKRSILKRDQRTEISKPKEKNMNNWANLLITMYAKDILAPTTDRAVRSSYIERLRVKIKGGIYFLVFSLAFVFRIFSLNINSLYFRVEGVAIERVILLFLVIAMLCVGILLYTRYIPLFRRLVILLIYYYTLERVASYVAHIKWENIKEISSYLAIGDFISAASIIAKITGVAISQCFEVEIKYENSLYPPTARFKKIELKKQLPLRWPDFIILWSLLGELRLSLPGYSHYYVYIYFIEGNRVLETILKKLEELTSQSKRFQEIV